ncbi:SPOR domain-containing protein [Novosphingobium sp. B 225]|uniref:SPOR domain-containing protein n=1 Tax=Novosphingobium sp. B 225 TaxID=1961849 RepID=UPI000B4A97A7|nr:SPOR domain-containing protein [Novosphingobium sp. B 225]
MGRKTFQLAAALVALTLAEAPGLADNKAGVDAWGRGDYATAVREWQGDIARGDADAMFNLAQAYKLGQGVKQDMAKAEELYGRAATLGHLQASDNYGLFLFQRGQRLQALPYIRAAADRGDPRAQYLLGLAHYNGENVQRDPVRAYALVSLAQQQGLEAAQNALLQMDKYVPMEQRQQAVALAAQLQSDADSTRARQLAAVDLGATVSSTPPVAAAAPVRAPIVVASADPVSAAARVAAGSSPATAGADYARPQVVSPPPRPVVHAGPPPGYNPGPPAVMAPPPSAPVAAAAAGGAWRVQLGAFGQPANADALWAKLKGRPELAGHARLNVRAGAVIKLQAGGFASEAAARAACGRLSASGQSCIAVRN